MTVRPDFLVFIWKSDGYNNISFLIILICSFNCGWSFSCTLFFNHTVIYFLIFYDMKMNVFTLLLITSHRPAQYAGKFDVIFFFAKQRMIIVVENYK